MSRSLGILAILLSACTAGSPPPTTPTSAPAVAPPPLALGPSEIACQKELVPFEVCSPDGWVAARAVSPFSIQNAEADPLAQAKKTLLLGVEVDGEILRAQSCIAAGSDVTSLANRVLVEEATATGSFSQQLITRLVEATVADFASEPLAQLTETERRTLESRVAVELRKQLTTSQAVVGGDAVYLRLSIPSTLANVQVKTPLPELAACDGRVLVDGFSAVAVKGLRVDAQKLSQIDLARLAAAASASLGSPSEELRASIETRLTQAFQRTRTATEKAQFNSNLLIPLSYRLQGYGITPDTQVGARKLLDTIRLVTKSP